MKLSLERSSVKPWIQEELLSWLWNSRPDLYPWIGSKGGHGCFLVYICFVDLFIYIYDCVLWDNLWGVIHHKMTPSIFKVDLVPGVGRTSPGLPLISDPVCFLSAQLWRGACWVWEPQGLISVFFFFYRWLGSVAVFSCVLACASKCEMAGMRLSFLNSRSRGVPAWVRGCVFVWSRVVQISLSLGPE